MLCCCCSCNVFVDPIMRLWFVLGPVFAVVRCVLSSLAIIGLEKGVLVALLIVSWLVNARLQ